MAAKTHIMRWAPQDWRTSRVRTRSAVSGDRDLRLVYLEILSALYESGGELSADPSDLADTLALPADVIARYLPVLEEIGRRGEGGIVIEGGVLINRRVTRELAEELEFRKTQADRGARGGRKRATNPPESEANAKRVLSGGLASANQPLSPPLPAPLPAPLPEDPPKPPATGGSRLELPVTKPKRPKRAAFDSTPTPDEQRVLGAVNDAARAKFTAATPELRGAILRSGVDACLLVVAHLAGDPKWQPGGEMAQYLDPITPFRPKAWETRLAKARAWSTTGRAHDPVERTNELLDRLKRDKAEAAAERAAAKAVGP